jgi:hypothetical protein
MTIKQLETKAEIAVGIFSCAAAGAFLDALGSAIPSWIAGTPATWPSVENIIKVALLTGLGAVVGWIKIRSPFAPPPKQ